MNWDEKAREYAESRTYEHLSHGENARHAVGVVRGARWQREALLSDETIERAARALFAWDTDQHPVPRPTWEGLSEDQRDVWRSGARVALTAAIGDDDE